MWKTLWQKGKLHILCNFFFCHYVFKKPSAAEASESVYMRERVNTSFDIRQRCILNNTHLLENVIFFFISYLMSFFHPKTTFSKHLQLTIYEQIVKKRILLKTSNILFPPKKFSSVWIFIYINLQII